MTSRPICAIDTETSGLHWEREAWEIALIRHDTGGTTELSFFVPISTKAADPKALEVGGYYDRHPVGKWLTDATIDESDRRGVVASAGFAGVSGIEAPQPDGDTYLWPDHAARVIQRMTHGATLVGAQPHFDTHLFERMLRRAELTPSWHYRLRDVESMVAGHFGNDPGGLTNCFHAMGFEPPDDLHTALGDARAALNLYDFLLGGPGQ